MDERRRTVDVGLEERADRHLEVDVVDLHAHRLAVTRDARIGADAQRDVGARLEGRGVDLLTEPWVRDEASADRHRVVRTGAT